MLSNCKWGQPKWANLVMQKKNRHMSNSKKLKNNYCMDIGRSNYIREELTMKQNCANCKKKMLVKIILDVLEVRPSDLVKNLHLSSTQVSRYISGERNSEDLDIYLIEQVFEIKVRDYDRITTAANLA